MILEINLPGIDGYETTRRLRDLQQTHMTPVIFLSSYTALDDRLQAYAAGGNDYISKPFDVSELQGKIAHYTKSIERHKQTRHELETSHGMLVDVQTTAAKLQSISRFIQATLFCHDINTLFLYFFKTAQEIGMEGVLQIQSHEGIEIRSSRGDISVLEREILEMSSAVERIHTFGLDRAIYHWKHVILLTHNVGDMIDTLSSGDTIPILSGKVLGTQYLSCLERCDQIVTQSSHNVTMGVTISHKSTGPSYATH